MNVSQVKTDYKKLLEKILDHELYRGINFFLMQQELVLNKTVYPPSKERFNAFNWFNIRDTRVIIVGQDPYHGEGQANGLSFSVKTGQKIPPSLRNIFREISNEYPDFDYTTHKDGNLEYLARQGVLLLNTSLTVEQGKPNSHAKAWRGFTRDLIQSILYETGSGVVLLLWGRNASDTVKGLKTNGHYILRATHPSPLGANKGGWFQCNHFRKTNEYLATKGKPEIMWIPW